MQHLDHSPQVHITLPHVNALLREISFDEKEMTRTPDLKIKQIGIRPGCGPQNLTLNAQWSQNLARLPEVTLHLRSGRGNLAFMIRLFAVVPGFRKAPGRMVQERAAEGEQPHEEE